MVSRFWAIACLLMVGGACSGDASTADVDRDKREIVVDIVINNVADLSRAIASAKGGETFILAPGDYGKINLHNLSFDQPIEIRSQNLSDLAHFDRVDIFQSKNVIISDINVGSPLDANEDITVWGSAIRVRSSEDVELRDLKIIGTEDQNPLNDRVGLYVVSSKNVTIADSEFSNLHHGAHFKQSTGLKIEGNDVHDIRVDGFNFAEVSDVVIDGNKFTDFWRQNADHSDAIQFFTAGTKAASTDIMITNNVILQGNGSGQQGIFMRDEVGTLPYERVTIQNNLVYVNSEFNGIAVGGGKDVTIEGNTVLSNRGDSFNLWIKVDNIENVHVRNNVTDAVIVGNNSNSSIGDNVDLQKNSGSASKLPGLNQNDWSDFSGLLMDGIGYHPVSPNAPGVPAGPSNPTVKEPDAPPPPAGVALGAVGQALGDYLVSAAATAQSQAKIQLSDVMEPSDYAGTSALGFASSATWEVDSAGEHPHIQETLLIHDAVVSASTLVSHDQALLNAMVANMSHL